MERSSHVRPALHFKPPGLACIETPQRNFKHLRRRHCGQDRTPANWKLPFGSRSVRNERGKWLGNVRLFPILSREQLFLTTPSRSQVQQSATPEVYYYYTYCTMQGWGWVKSRSRSIFDTSVAENFWATPTHTPWLCEMHKCLGRVKRNYDYSPLQIFILLIILCTVFFI